MCIAWIHDPSQMFKKLSLFFCVKRLNCQGIHCEINAVYGGHTMYRPENRLCKKKKKAANGCCVIRVTLTYVSDERS